MKLNWFTRKGFIYLPASVAGWLVFLIALTAAGYMFVTVNNQSHSVSDALINFVFNFLIIGLCYTIIAWFTEAPPKTSITKR